MVRAREEQCSANIFVRPEANVTIERCTAEGGQSCSGGAVHAVDTFEQAGGSVNIQNCSLHSVQNKSFGGGVFCGRALQSGGHMALQACNAQEHGGCLYTAISAHQAAGASARFEGCQSSQHGGAVYSTGDTSLQGHIVFRKSWVQFGSGGGMHVVGNLKASALVFHDCHAGVPGGGLFVRGDTIVGEISFTGCYSIIASTVLVQEGSFKAAKLTVEGMVDDSLGQHMVVTDHAAGEIWKRFCTCFINDLRCRAA